MKESLVQKQQQCGVKQLQDLHTTFNYSEAILKGESKWTHQRLLLKTEGRTVAGNNSSEIDRNET